MQQSIKRGTGHARGRGTGTCNNQLMRGTGRAVSRGGHTASLGVRASWQHNIYDTLQYEGHQINGRTGMGVQYNSQQRWHRVDGYASAESTKEEEKGGGKTKQSTIKWKLMGGGPMMARHHGNT